MKLPRLSDPKTYQDGDLEVTVASQFDLFPTWAQYLTMLILFAPLTVVALLLFMVQK